ncbi:hypothetical protein ACIQV2_32970 [Streptomyces globosus]|uniref:hypothetical protein n=1 Tax=Streptomyces globosus TaxID=68209 RepID=UPI0038160B60
MIRLPSTHAAITAPLPAYAAEFPGVLIGRSMLDGRPFHLSPVMTDHRVLPSTSSLALGGLGSGKSTTDKVWIAREIREHHHQAVVIDSFGEDGVHGEWQPITTALGGRVIRAGEFTINPLSPLFPRPVREQLVRSLIAAVEPDALTAQATHALQHAMGHPKASGLRGLVDALVRPDDGTWPAATLAEWGQSAAIALSRYTDGALTGLFDGPDADLPDTDLPILSFDFTALDRNSPAIPALMAAVTCWAEHVWLPQSTAVHRHLVLEEAWQLLLSPVTAELVQRLIKNSRKAALSIKGIMHTLSDLGDGRAQDLAKLCEIAHVGRLGPEEAVAVGALLGLPQWAVDVIPTLGPGQAVWKVGAGHVDLVQTVLTEEEAALTDTSTRRRRAQQAVTSLAKEASPEDEPEAVGDEPEAVGDEPERFVPEAEAEAEAEAGPAEYPLAPPGPDAAEAGVWDWEMPPNLVDARHYDVVRAAREGRCGEAADLAVIGERQDIRAYGINSDEALRWLSTRAAVADLCGSRDTAAQLRATVTRMGKNVEWWDQAVPGPVAPQAQHPAPAPPPALLEEPSGHDDQADGKATSRRRTWLTVSVFGRRKEAETGEKPPRT